MAKRERSYEQIQAALNDPRRCVEDMIPTAGLRMHYHRCYRKGVIQRQQDGKLVWFCRQHDPEEIAKKSKALDAKIHAEIERDRRKWRLESSAPLGYELAKLLVNAQPFTVQESQKAEALARKIIAQVEGSNG